MKKFRALFVILAIFAVAAMVIPTLAQDAPPNRFSWLECNYAGAAYDPDLTGGNPFINTGFWDVTRCWMEGNFAGVSVWVDFHDDDEFDPLNDDPDENFVVSMGIDDGRNEWTVFYYDRSDDPNLDNAVMLDNGNYMLVRAIGVDAGLYYLPATGEYQINYKPEGSNIEYLMRMVRQRDGNDTLYAVSSFDAYYVPDLPAPVEGLEE